MTENSFTLNQRPEITGFVSKEKSNSTRYQIGGYIDLIDHKWATHVKNSMAALCPRQSALVAAFSCVRNRVFVLSKTKPQKRMGF